MLWVYDVYDGLGVSICTNHAREATFQLLSHFVPLYVSICPIFKQSFWVPAAGSLSNLVEQNPAQTKSSWIPVGLKSYRWKKLQVKKPNQLQPVNIVFPIWRLCRPDPIGPSFACEGMHEQACCHGPAKFSSIMFGVMLPLNKKLIHAWSGLFASLPKNPNMVLNRTQKYPGNAKKTPGICGHVPFVKSSFRTTYKGTKILAHPKRSKKRDLWVLATALDVFLASEWFWGTLQERREQHRSM